MHASRVYQIRDVSVHFHVFHLGIVAGGRPWFRMIALAAALHPIRGALCGGRGSALRQHRRLQRGTSRQQAQLRLSTLASADAPAHAALRLRLHRQRCCCCEYVYMPASDLPRHSRTCVCTRRYRTPLGEIFDRLCCAVGFPP